MKTEDQTPRQPIPKPTVASSTTIPSTTSTPDGWIAYQANRERFRISHPPTLRVAAAGQGYDDLGRIGTISINRSGVGYSEEDPVSIHVYRDIAALETDYSAYDGGADLNKRVFMGGSGLQQKTETINGTKMTIFYGTHAIDGVGGTEYAEVDAVVIGPTYAYMIQFHGMGTDPNSAQIQNYLRSFQAL